MNNSKRDEGSDFFDSIEYSRLGYLNDLSTLANNQDDFSAEQVLESSKYVFDSILEHLQYMDLVFFDIDHHKTNCEIRDLRDSYKHSKSDILDTMNQLFMMHVDESEYLETMNLLNTKILEMIDLDSERLSRKDLSSMVSVMPLILPDCFEKRATTEIHTDYNLPQSESVAAT